MVKRLACVFVLLPAVALGPTPAAPPRDYPIRAVPMTAVTIDDGFWAPKLEINRTVTIPHILKENDDTGRVANFEKAARPEERRRTRAAGSTTPTSTRSSRRRRTRSRLCPIRGSARSSTS